MKTPLEIYEAAREQALAKHDKAVAEWRARDLRREATSEQRMAIVDDCQREMALALVAYRNAHN